SAGMFPISYIDSPISTMFPDRHRVYFGRATLPVASPATTLPTHPCIMSSVASALPQLYSYGHALEMDDDKIGLLRDSSDAANDFEELRRRFTEDGYLYMKGYLDKDVVLAARRSITDRLAGAGMLDPAHPNLDAVCPPGSGYGFRPDLTEHNPEVNALL